MTPEERLDEVAAILAQGIARQLQNERQRLLLPPPARLDFSADESVHAPGRGASRPLEIA